MKLIIDIDEDTYYEIKDGFYDDNTRRMAIAIGHGTPFEQLRAEIESKEMVETTSEHQFYNMALNDVLQIIDKYKAEGSGKE